MRLEKLTDQGYIGEEVKIHDEDFNIDELNIDGELCKAGRLLLYYGDLAAELKAQSARKKTELEEYDAELAQRIRSEVSDKRVTENDIKEKLRLNDVRQAKMRMHIESEKDAIKSDNLFKAQRYKVECLRALAYKQGVEISKGAF